MAGEQQWLRYFRLYVQRDSGSQEMLDLSDYRVKFHITQNSTGRPCTAEISVYNVSDATANRISCPMYTRIDQNKQHYRVIIDAGYQSHHGVIFKGDLWWKSMTRETETDTYLRLIAATGWRGYENATVSASVPAGSSQYVVVDAASKTLEPYGVQVARTPQLSPATLPRGKVLYGMTRDCLQSVADTNQIDWAFTDRGIIGLQKGNPPAPQDIAEVIILEPSTGLLDRPEVTTMGVKAKMLLNPSVEFGSYVSIASSHLKTPDYSTNYSAVNENLPATGTMVDPTGVYLVKSREHTGDTRGDAWYTDVIAIGTTSGVQAPLDGTYLNFMPNMK